MKRNILLFLVLLLTSCSIDISSSFDDKQSMNVNDKTSTTREEQQAIEENGFIDNEFSIIHFEKIKVPTEYDLYYDENENPTSFYDKLIKSNQGLMEFKKTYPTYYSKYENKINQVNFQKDQLLIITIFYSITFNLLHVYTFNETVFPIYESKEYEDFDKSEFKDNDIEEGYSFNHIIGITISNTINITKIVYSSIINLYELEIFP